MKFKLEVEAPREVAGSVWDLTIRSIRKIAEELEADVHECPCGLVYMQTEPLPLRNEVRCPSCNRRPENP